MHFVNMLANNKNNN